MTRPPNKWLVNETGAIVRNPAYKKPVFDLENSVAFSASKRVWVPKKPSKIRVLLGKGRSYVLHALEAL